ncbi:hypothetical protein JTB14_036015 [Gonioctena quinquepunctata]|nr:hypothetical protein JTB14_036015 [Gonioctena quinquepunctata]
MGRRGPVKWGLALALVLVAQQSLAGEVCRSGCGGASTQTFKYAQGTTYKYNYEGKIDITLSSAEGQSTSTEVKAVVLLTQLADCNQVLRLENVQVLGANGKKFGTIPNVDKPIRINFHDGHIEDSICTEPGDTQNSLNIKRAIASLFQVNSKQAHETDVFERTSDTISSQPHSIRIARSNRAQCSTENTPPSSRSKNGILDQATAVENYLYVPFSAGNQGARAEVTSKLQFKGTTKDTKVNKCSVPKTIIFDNPHSGPAPTSNVNTVLNSVKALLKTIDVVVGPETAKQFVNLVKTIRAAKKDDLLAVYNQVKSGAGLGDKVLAKRSFLDALLQAGTGDSIEVAITLLKIFMNTAAALLDQPDLSHEAYLGIGTLAGRYCRQHPCENVAAINKLSQKLTQKVGNGKPANKKSENEMVFALKALRNFNHLSDAVVQKIIAVAQNKQAPNRLRVVALETYLSDACKDKLRNSALHILQDIQQDSEVRIKAYQVLAQCPTAKIGTAIKALLDKEPSYQVGGYIVSHIRNIKASANPDKDLAKQHLGFSVPKKFPIDFRKWSYNAEFSYAVDTLGIAASSECNVIYSQDSFLPRSSSLNLTGELFGHTFNFLEINTRQENLDKLVEHYFGPKGVLNTASLGNIWSNKEKNLDDLFRYVDRKLGTVLRSRRDVSKSEIDTIGKAVQIKENALNKDLDLDLSVKAFGSEVLFTNLNVYQQGLTPEAIIDKIVESFAKGLDKLKDYKETLRSNLIFMDTQLDYPTGLGFPLRLAAEGTANIQVQAEGQIDVRALINSRATKVHVKLVPSVSIEVNGRLTLDASLVENGLKLVSTLYTATGGDLTINLEHKGIDVKFGLPLEKQNIISGNHEIVFIAREQSGHETISPLKFAQAKDFSICLDHLNPFIGLAFCAEMNGPNLAGELTPALPYPLAGDAKFSVTIENEDLLEYHLKAESIPYEGHFLFEAIGKNKQKLSSFQVDGALRPEIFIKAVLDSSEVRALAEGRITNNAQEKSVLLKVVHNQMDIYGKVGVAISGSAGRSAYKPILEYRGPAGAQELPIKVDGQILAEQNGQSRKYTFDNVKLNLPNNIISLTGNIGNDENDLYSDLTLSNGQLSGSLKGRLHLDPNLVKFNVEVKNSINPLVNFNLKGEVKKTDDNSQYDTSFQLIHGADLSSKTNMITMANSFTKKWRSSNDFTVAAKHKLTYPLLGVNVAFEFEQTPKSFDYDLDFEYEDIKFGSELELELNTKTLGDYDIEFEIYGLGNRVEFKGNRLIEGEQSKINNELQVNGQKLEVKGTIKHHIQSASVDVGADLTIILPTHPTPFQVNSHFKYNHNEIDAQNKITSGSTVVVDAFLKANRNGNANGSIKVNVKNILVVNGQLKSTKGTGEANLLIDAQSLKKQVKLESTFQVHPGTTYNVVVTLYPTFNKDKNQKIILSTNNKISKTNIDSKNSITVLGKKLEANLKSSRTADDENEKLNGEVEVILPNNQYLLGKVNQDFKYSTGILNGVGASSLEYRKNKNAAGRKISVKGTFVNTNWKEALYDATYNIAADDSNGKNINADLSFKSLKQGETRKLQGENKIYGSILKQPIAYNYDIKYTDAVGDYKISSSYGQQAALKLEGKYDLKGQGKPVSGDVAFELTSPNKDLRSLKVGLSGLLLIPKENTETFQWEGGASIFADDDGTVPDAIIDFKGDGKIRASDKDGEIKGNVRHGKLEPISAVAGYSCKGSDKQKEIHGNVGLQYGQGKNYKVEGSLSRLNENEYKANAELNTPYDEYKKILLTVHTKSSDDQRHVNSQVVLNHDGKVWNLDSELLASDISPLIDLKLKDPQGKKNQFYLKATNLGGDEFGGETKIVCEKKDFLLEGNIEANVQNIENFFLKGNVNSPALKLNKVTFEAQNKPGKTGKRIQVTIKSAGKNILAGSTSYQARDEHGKYIVEGSGSFKVKEETKTASFKYICQRLTPQKNGEQGVEVSIEGSVGDKAIDTEFKLSNKQFRALTSYCEKTKECAHVEIDSNTIKDEIDHYNHVLEISLDLRKLGFPQEFGLKSVTDRNNYVLDHTMDVHFQGKENKKYQYSVFVHPNEAGITLTTPKRIVSLEANVKVPKDLSAEAKWVHPGLQRPLTASLKTQHIGDPLKGKSETVLTSNFDIFAQPGQKMVIVATYSQDLDNNKFKDSLAVKSTGLGIELNAFDESELDKKTFSGKYHSEIKYVVGNSKYDNVFSIQAGKSQFDFLLKALNVNVLKIVSTLNLNKGAQVIDTEVSTYDNKPVASHLEIKNLNTVLYTVGFKDTPREKLQLNAGLIPGQIADVRADYVTGSGKVNLLKASISLAEADFLKPDYNVNAKEIEKVLQKCRDESAKQVQRLQTIGDQWSNDISKEVNQFGEISEKATPNLQPLKQYYVNELQKIKKEILQDKAIKDLGELFEKVFGTLARSVAELLLKFSEFVAKLVQSLQSIFTGLINSLGKNVIPEVKDLINKLTGVITDLVDVSIEIVSGYIATISEIMEKYQPEIKQLAAIFSELGQNIARFIQKSYDEVRKIFTGLTEKLYQELKALPVFEEMQVQYEEFIKNGLPNKEVILGTLKEIAATIKDLIPPEIQISKELEEILDLTTDYIEKKLTNKSVDDFAVLDKWISLNLSLLSKILGLLTSPLEDVQRTEVPISFDYLKNLPKLVAVKFSPVSYLLAEDTTEELITFLLSLWTNPRQWFAPFPMFGILIQGRHIFTFDGKYITFPGNCKYLLARDAGEGNFTLVGTYNNGRLSAITLADKHDSITIKDNEQVLLNNAVTELPARKPELSAWRDYQMIYIKSTAGVRVECTLDLGGCGVWISGFYHSQVRGLLGNGNNEPYDDFTIPNGKIVTSESEFGNSYKIGSCQAVTVPKTDLQQEDPACNKLFSWDSSMSPCYPFVKTDIFKLACARGLAAKVKNTEAGIASAYVASCLEHNIPIGMPSNLLKCTNSETPLDVGERFSVKVPNKAADIVVLVDTTKSNEKLYVDLVKPMLQDVTKTLSTKGLDDLHIHLIAYGGENQWPSHVTVGGKLNFKGKLPDLKFSDAPTEKFSHGILIDIILDIFKPAERFIHDVKLAVGATLEGDTYREAYNYPFRAQAVKSIIVVTSKPCEVGSLKLLQQLRTLLFQNDQISVNLITPFEKFSAKDSKKSADIIGFNNRNVFTVSLGKKKPEGNSELYKDIVYDDYCVDFTIKNRGNVFISNNFVSAKADARKQFIHIAAHNIVEEVLNVEEGLDCECKRQTLYSASNVCKEVYSKERPTKKAATKS